MEYLGVGVSPGNVPVFHFRNNLRVFDKRLLVTELVLRCFVCGLACVSIFLITTDTEMKEFFTVEKRARFTDVKVLIFLVTVSGLAAGYSLMHMIRCCMSVMRKSVVLNKPLAWAIFSGDQIMAYLIFSAVAASVQAGLLSQYGQSALQWMKTCNMFKQFCNKMEEGLIISVILCLLMVVLSIISTFGLFRLYGNSNHKC